MILELLSFAAEHIFEIAVGGAAVVAAGALVEFTINEILNKKTIAQGVGNRCPNAVKVLIKERKAQAVNVDIFGKNEELIESNVTISSSKGISRDLRVGQKIYV